jgi:hypothetical protein
MVVMVLPKIRCTYKCEHISQVTKLVEAASRLEAVQIKVTPHPNSLETLWRWTVEVELAGEDASLKGEARAQPIKEEGSE